MARSWAYLLTGMIFYIPANTLPVMSSVRLGRESESTILSGLMEFWRAGAWDIAAIIFVASVVVPCTKFLTLGFLLITARKKVVWARKERTRLYRLVDSIGYWSMLDVLVVAMVCALMQFKALSYVEPRVGILFFGLVVIFTMLSSVSFDPRLIWDTQEDDEFND